MQPNSWGNYDPLFGLISKRVRRKKIAVEYHGTAVLCPGGMHAWCDTNVGRIRKPVSSIPSHVKFVTEYVK